MKKVILLAIATLSLISAFAQQSYMIQNEGKNIYYYLDEENKTAQVTYKNEDPYSGDYVIPEKVNYGDEWDYTVTEIGDQAFGYNSNVTSIVLPNSITTIATNAFYDCTALTELKLPATTTTLSNFILNGSGVTVLYCLATTVPETTAKTFKNFGSNTTLYVPQGTKALYEAEANWASFKEIIEIEEEDKKNEENKEPEETQDAISTTSNSIQIIVANNTITVTNAHDVVVYNIAGGIVGKGNVVSVQFSGIYFITADGKSFKVFVK